MPNEIFIQSRYHRNECSGITFVEPTLTQQHFQSECDINEIMKKYAVTGTLPNVSGAFYDDLPDITDFFSLQNYLIQAEDSFMSLPSAIRKRFENDPGQLMDFIGNPANYEEAVSLGLLSSSSLKKEEEIPSPEELTPKEESALS